MFGSAPTSAVDLRPSESCRLLSRRTIKAETSSQFSALLRKMNHPLFPDSFSVVELECCHRKTQNPKSVLVE
ncbi:hypothetical protein KOW79_004916 [Hemibagrus wyckioides]|uniref:Uncharacterized protein n=1 Tax=Hemibagrus wyckioides TaxID=337641 RepID=A0A9D3P1S4_9TELE|nr:hypothetical protein KOW79_004916 [Hemibagrus wyckioides]